MRADVVVVGAGPAGLASATRLAEAGRQVLVLARGNGFTHWGAGAVDVLGRVGGEPVDQPLEAIDRLPEGHPYHLVGQAAVRDGARLVRPLRRRRRPAPTPATWSATAPRSPPSAPCARPACSPNRRRARKASSRAGWRW